ncbi:hypothetical protein L228DRAFT_17767 [Xylona heveae TC161]|uniref:Uncharacterized protein n=1 Tax=Xylona heveae (strain CBS 132557 / TC161) TaxID=1328760 RepID=A0A165JX67_XYLHT|nr:hypothetical protein L228DRAFT_17767 [Xylona heveae TC161]KZF26736.1 hypothetical protein L228DRAFT_17767 [Xylona heveae TC161]
MSGKFLLWKSSTTRQAKPTAAALFYSFFPSHRDAVHVQIMKYVRMSKIPSPSCHKSFFFFFFAPFHCSSPRRQPCGPNGSSIFFLLLFTCGVGVEVGVVILLSLPNLWKFPWSTLLRIAPLLGLDLRGLEDQSFMCRDPYMTRTCYATLCYFL